MTLIPSKQNECLAFRNSPSRYRCRRVSRGGIATPNSESSTNNFQVNQAFDVSAKEIRQCKSPKLIKKTILFQL